MAWQPPNQLFPSGQAPDGNQLGPPISSQGHSVGNMVRVEKKLWPVLLQAAKSLTAWKRVSWADKSRERHVLTNP